MARNTTQAAAEFKHHRKFLGLSAHPRQCGEQYSKIINATVVKSLLPFDPVFSLKFRASQHGPIWAFPAELPPRL